MSLTKEELGQRIRTARESGGLTQEQLGNAVELSRIAIRQIEAGSRSVSSIELDRIAYAVGRDKELWHALQGSLALGHEMTNLERLLGS